jgi:hypothetical protein
VGIKFITYVEYEYIIRLQNERELKIQILSRKEYDIIGGNVPGRTNNV